MPEVRIGLKALDSGVLARPGAPRDPKSHLFAAKWVAMPSFEAGGPWFCAELRPGACRVGSHSLNHNLVFRHFGHQKSRVQILYMCFIFLGTTTSEWAYRRSVAGQPAPSASEARRRRAGRQPAGRESDVGGAVRRKPSTATRGAHEARAAARGWRVASTRFGSLPLPARRSSRLLRPAGNALPSSGSARRHLSVAPGTPARLVVRKRVLTRKFAE